MTSCYYKAMSLSYPDHDSLHLYSQTHTHYMKPCACLAIALFIRASDINSLESMPSHHA